MNYAFLSIKVVEGSTQRVQVRSLQTERHEEADTALIFYAGQFCKEDKNMVIRCDDTDVFILLLHHQKWMSGEVFMDLGHSSKNNRRTRDMKQVARAWGPPVSNMFIKYFQLS